MMSSTTDEDPFLQVQADVLSALNSTRPLFKSYLRIRSINTNVNSPELVSAREELESALAALAEDVADLVESVNVVMLDPYKYGFDIEEVTRRKRLVDEVGAEIEDMREELQRKIEDTNSQGHGRGGADPFADPRAGEEASDSYAEFEQQQQLHIMAEQDQQLDGVFRTVGNLRQQADVMGRELEEQVEMLETVDTLADRVGGRLQNGMKKMGTVIKKNEHPLSSCCIAALIFVLILLLILVLVL